MILPALRSKRRKTRYIKPDAVRELERLAMDEAGLLHPMCPHLAPRVYRDDSSNALTACIVKYITLKGGFASRVNNQGTYNINSGRYIPSTSKRGLPDIIGTYQGKSLMIEVKYSKDVLSEHQLKVQDQVTASGGLYYVAHSFAEFKSWIDNINNTEASPEVLPAR